jgi:hypothetical protein
VSITVTAPDGTSKTYTVTIARDPLGGNNNLQSLTVSSLTAGLTPSFNPNTTSYTGSVASGVGSVTVTALPQDSGATVSINNQATTSRSVTLNAAGTNTAITIVVTAPNGNPKTYTVTIARDPLGGSNNLQSLTVSSLTAGLTPSFNPNTTSYTGSVASGVGSVTVTALPQDSGATVSINNQATTSRSVTLNAAGTNTAITIVVTAPNGNPKTYTVTVSRMPPNSAELANIQITSHSLTENLCFHSGFVTYPLTPSFNPAGTTYTVDVPSNINICIVMTRTSLNQTVTLNGTPIQHTPPGDPLMLFPFRSSNTALFTIVVTAPDGVTTKTYTIDPF